jgi:hypothetical protein
MIARWASLDLTARAVVTVAAFMAAAAAAGWLIPLYPETPVRTQLRPIEPVFVHPGPALAEAAYRLGADPVSAPDAEEPDTSIDVTPPAPRIGVADAFRKALVAVVVEGDVRVAYLSGDSGAPVRLTEGAAWRDGWRVTSVRPDVVVIARGAESRRIAVMGALPDAVGATDESGPRPRLTLTRAEARSAGR